MTGFGCFTNNSCLFGGAMGGILFCDHYAHAPLSAESGVAMEHADADHIKTLEEAAKERPGDTTD